MSKPRIIAFYLPQFYPTPENDEWWGKGFTEWTNVGRAKPLFKGHYQPKVPADLGYYDLRLPEVREQQAELAKEAGIEGFCYWHYWFGNGKRLLDRVFSEVVESGKPDYPFCLCWANHSWYQKTWDPTKPDKLLIKQTYPGVDDYVAHFNEMLPAFKDKRYMKVNGKLIFGVFAPLDIPDFRLFRNTWNKLAKENGLDSFCFFGYLPMPSKEKQVLNDYDYVCIDYYSDVIRYKNMFLKRCIKWFKSKFFCLPRVALYKDYVNFIIKYTSEDKRVWPCILPNYDHTPRSGRRGFLFHSASPDLFGNLLINVFKKRSKISEKENIVFLKAWNEWGEGNYLEPDLVYGKGYLAAIKESLKFITE